MQLSNRLLHVWFIVGDKPSNLRVILRVVYYRASCVSELSENGNNEYKKKKDDRHGPVAQSRRLSAALRIQQRILLSAALRDGCVVVQV